MSWFSLLKCSNIFSLSNFSLFSFSLNFFNAARPLAFLSSSLFRDAWSLKIPSMFWRYHGITPDSMVAGTMFWDCISHLQCALLTPSGISPKIRGIPNPCLRKRNIATDQWSPDQRHQTAMRSTPTPWLLDIVWEIAREGALGWSPNLSNFSRWSCF